MTAESKETEEDDAVETGRESGLPRTSVSVEEADCALLGLPAGTAVLLIINSALALPMWCAVPIFGATFVLLAGKAWLLLTAAMADSDVVEPM